MSEDPDEFLNLRSKVTDPWSVELIGLDAIQQQLDVMGENVAEVILKAEQSFNKKSLPFYEKRKKFTSKIDNFWKKAFLNHHFLSKAIPEEQEDLIEVLRDLEVQEFDDLRSGFKIIMTFDVNEFFENKVITKSYHLKSKPPKTQITEIQWKENQKPHMTSEDGDTTITFLEWLTHAVPPKSDEIAHVIKDDLFINPLQYYMKPDIQEVEEDDIESFMHETRDAEMFQNGQPIRRIPKINSSMMEVDDTAEGEDSDEKEEEATNCTYRVPQSQNGEAITPIRFKRGNGKKRENTRTIFDQIPMRGNSSGPLASSTPQAPPPQQPRRFSNIENNRPAGPIPERETQFASDADMFAVSKRAPSKTTSSTSTSAVLFEGEGAYHFLDEVDDFFDTLVIETRERKPQRRRIATSPSPDPRRRRSSSRDRERYGSYESSSRYTRRYNDDDYDDSRMSRRDIATFKRRHEGGRDNSRMSRKREYYRSPDDFEYRRRRNDDRDKDYYNAYDSRHIAKRSRLGETSSSSGRSVRFEDDYRRSKDPRNFRDHRNRTISEKREDDKKLNEILKREKELLARLQELRKPSTSSHRDSYSSEEEETFNMADEWERENQEIMDNSMMFDDGLSKKKIKRRSGRGAVKKQLSRTSQSKKPHRKPAEPRKKTIRDPLETDDLNDSIASHRPRRSCVTPSTNPVPKKISWPKRDLDRLKHVIELMKPTTSDKYWIEVTRLLAKEGVDSEAVKQIAITKLKWEEHVQNEEMMKMDEEEEKKRRRGAVARIKEGVKMHEELREGGDKKADDLKESGVEAMEDYQPEDVAADQSLLALGTPIAEKKKGGTRASIMPKPVEDSPMAARCSNSTFNSPRLDQTKAKEVETTLKYVQHLSMMKARPSSSKTNKSYLNKSSTRGSRNTSMSLEQGTRRAMKIINRDRTIHEDDEEDEADEDYEFEEQDGDTSIY